MDPTDLPDEVAERIFILLPVDDVLSCCLVNTRWRDAVNKNLIWKQHCTPHLDLENTESTVNPAFQVPLCSCEDLAPLCKYRLKYMREVHLRNNFRNQRCVEYKFSRSHVEKIEFLDKYLLMNDSYKNMFHVWDIQKNPHHTHTVPYLLQKMCTQTFQAAEDCLLIVQCNLLQVYVVVDGMFTLKMCRIFDKEEEFSKMIPVDDTISDWYRNDTISDWYFSEIGLYPCDFTSYNEVVGKYFVGIVEPVCFNESMMHIWDLKSGSKLKEEALPDIAEEVDSICCGNNAEYLYIALYLRAPSLARCKIFCYNLKKLQFTQFYVESDHSIPFMLFEKKIVLVPCDQWENSGSYSFLDSVTGNKIVQKEFDNPINPKAVDVYEFIMAFGSSNTVTLVNLNTLDVVCTFSVNFEVMEVYLLDGNMLLVGGVDYHFVLEVWDIKKKCHLYTLDERSILLCGRQLSRLCLQSSYSIHVLNFW